MKKLFLALILIFGTAKAMEQPLQQQRGTKRPTPEIETSPEMELSDVETVPSQSEKQEPVSIQSFAKTKSAIEALPADLRKMIVAALAQADDQFRAQELKELLEGTPVTVEDVGGTGLSQLFRAAEGIRHLLLSNKTYVPLLNDLPFTESIIKELRKTYGYNLVFNAIALGTDAASKVYASVVERNFQNKIPLLNSFQILKEAIVNNDIAIVNFIFKHLSPDVAASLVNNKMPGEPSSLLMDAVFNKRMPIVARLLKVPTINVNLQTEQGAFALYVAAQFDITEAIDPLITAGADVNLQMTQGGTALHQAAGKGFTAFVQKLIAAGAQINKANNNGDTPLLHAAIKGKEEVVKILLTVPGIDINAVNKAGHTALTLAAKNGYTGIVKELIDHGVNLDTQGKQALAEAINNGHVKVVEELVAPKKIDLNQMIQGHRILWYTRNKNIPNKDAIIKLLVENGALE